ncbi:hypothetical protein BDV96DRAFT_561414 [Lophiotrema nucula]|uniref:Uncharacterized protein n=1 Tax=Lophiotrema nucula TaxID=690887 RepID=A0A6A5ZWQ4_9PLEO|nr:hypothetical protein BDV96DRAFT_561414 [Lophiotrema nucula]
MPMAHLWNNTAWLASGESLPTGVPTFTIAAIVLAACVRLLNPIFGITQWRNWTPSVVAISVGTLSVEASAQFKLIFIAMLVPPSITLSKLLGALLRLVSLQYLGFTEVDLMSAATGCILTEGTFGFLPLLLAGNTG